MYSTTLWHLHREVQLSALAQDLTELDKNSPEVCACLGSQIYPWVSMSSVKGCLDDRTLPSMTSFLIVRYLYYWSFYFLG